MAVKNQVKPSGDWKAIQLILIKSCNITTSLLSAKVEVVQHHRICLKLYDFYYYISGES